MITRLPLWLILSLITFRSFSQDCGTDIIHKRKLQTDSVYRRTFEENKKLIAKTIQLQKAANIIGSYYGMETTIYTIPVVVHVLYTGGAEGTIFNPSTTDIQNTIAYLNSVYNGTMAGVEGAGDIGIQFELATRDPDNDLTTGIDRVNLGSIPEYVSNGVALTTADGVPDDQLKSMVRWDPGLYYNIYVVNKIDGRNAQSGGPFIAGYAQYPDYFVNTDGAVILATAMMPNKKTLPHEIGHALGLAHPFEGGNTTTCPPSGPCGTTGDLICDTDPITQPAFVARTGTNSCTGTPWNIDTEHNFMNYTDVFTLFTNDQKARMQAYMTYPTRASLVSSWAKSAAYPYTFSSPIGTCASTSDAIGLGGGYAGLMGVTVENRVFSSGITATDPGYIDKSNSPLHLVPLSRNSSYSLSADLYTLNQQQVAAWIDYNNDGLFDNLTELILYGNNVTGGGEITTITTSFVVPPSAVTNTVLRMRVINELASIYGPYNPTISDACYDPIYGQTEDFPVYVTSTLPASWRYFKGKKTGNDVLLQWETMAENKKFDIERSVDGATFFKIGTVSGSERSYMDHEAHLPLYFYRLVQTTINDESTFSSVLIVRSDKVIEDQSVRVTNPFQNTIDLVLETGFASPATAELIDLNGRIVAQKQVPAWQKTIKIDVGNKHLPAGIYMLRVKAGAVVITKKLVKK